MTAIEKAKEALKNYADEIAYSCYGEYCKNADICKSQCPHRKTCEITAGYREAIAALKAEKPVEDARKLSHWIQSGAHDYQEFWDCVVSQEIQQYAEAYHERKMKESGR